MAELLNIDEIELRLRADLEEAEQRLRNATPTEKPEARRQFKQALRRFSLWAFERKLEPDTIGSR